MDQNGISDSRFNMWRAVIAMAHADKYLAPQEEEFVDQYLSHVPFSSSQKQILIDDILNPKSVVQMFDKIEAPEDQGEFFSFARMMAWCDGDFHRQEEEILNKLKEAQMSALDPDRLKDMVANTRNSGRLQRFQERRKFEEEAHDKLSLGAIISSVFD